MKRILLFVIYIFLTSVIYSQEYWVHKPSPTEKLLTRIEFIDTVYGWAAGDSSTIINTSNSGQSWVVQLTGISVFTIEDISFVNQRLGWGLINNYYSFGASILKTTNGGTNWQILPFPDTNVYLASVYFLDSLNGFIGAHTGEIYKTTNAGVNWNSCRIDTNYCPYLYLFPKLNINFLNSQTGYAAGGHIDLQGLVWRTTDGGLNWLTYCVTAEPVVRIKPISSAKIIATGGDYEFGAIMSSSYNSGNNWEYYSPGFFGMGFALAFRTESELWIPLGFSQKWALSLDSGSSTGRWFNISAPDSTSVYDAMFVTPTFGWACGTNGGLLKYNSAIFGITKNEHEIPLNNTLLQNYPNPFNPTTIISYNLVQKSFVRFYIYDLLGREVRRYTEGWRPIGYNKLTFNATGLASGIYIYKIETEHFVQSKKMIILK